MPKTPILAQKMMKITTKMKVKQVKQVRKVNKVRKVSRVSRVCLPSGRRHWCPSGWVVRFDKRVNV
jgi:hypothetical protein